MRSSRNVPDIAMCHCMFWACGPSPENEVQLISPVYTAVCVGEMCRIALCNLDNYALFNFACFPNSLKSGLQATITPDEQLRIVVEALTEFIERRVKVA